MMDKFMKKSGQVTIFIIVGVVIIVGILALVFLMSNKGRSIGSSESSPEKFISECVRGALDDSISKMMINGGEVNMSHVVMYNGTMWNYLCYQADYYLPCYNVHPMLEMQIEREIEADIGDDIKMCFDSMREDFGDRGFEVDEGDLNYSVDLLPGRVAVSLRKRINVEDIGGARTFEDFSVESVSPIYDLVRVVRDIVNDESEFCNFERNGYMFLYPKYNIKLVRVRNNKIYRVIDRRNKNEFKFAIRTCALPNRL